MQHGRQRFDITHQLVGIDAIGCEYPDDGPVPLSKPDVVADVQAKRTLRAGADDEFLTTGLNMRPDTILKPGRIAAPRAPMPRTRRYPPLAMGWTGGVKNNSSASPSTLPSGPRAKPGASRMVPMTSRGQAVAAIEQ